MRRFVLIGLLLVGSCSDDSGGRAPVVDAAAEMGPPADLGLPAPGAARLERPTDLLPRPPSDRLPPDLFPPTAP